MAAIDDQAVRETVLDYFEGWFDGDELRMDRALHPELVKRWAGDSEQAFGPTVTKQRMLELTGVGAGAKDRGGAATEVRVVDVHRDIACAVARSGPYREYLQLYRTPNGWRIVGALWQFDGDGQFDGGGR